MQPAHPAVVATVLATAPPPEPAGRPGLRAALRSEWIKLRSIRSTRGVLALSAASGAALVLGLTAAAPATAPTIADALAFPVVFAAVFASVTGITLFTAEVQHHTLAPLLATQPNRNLIVAAKAITAIGLGAAVALVGQIGGVIAGVAVRTELGSVAEIVGRATWAALFVAGAASLGLGVGMTVRHGTGAIAGLLVWWLVVENLVVVLAPARIARLLPFVAGNGMVGVEMESPDRAAVALSRLANAGLLGGYALFALIVGTALLHRRDDA